jgi:hypothetical protein
MRYMSDKAVADCLGRSIQGTRHFAASATEVNIVVECDM